MNGRTCPINSSYQVRYMKTYWFGRESIFARVDEEAYIPMSEAFYLTAILIFISVVYIAIAIIITLILKGYLK